jgi:alanine racemase
MTLRTRVAETAGPGRAVLPLGAGHGLPRAAAGRAAVLVGERRCPVTEIALDRTVVETRAGPGAQVIVFGTGDNGEPTASDWAGWAGTNPHEILTGVGGRVPRRYKEAA